MTDSERETFGTGAAPTRAECGALYDQLVRLEVALLVEVRVFSTLTDNPQVQAEARIQELFERELVSDDEAMITRSIVPFSTRLGKTATDAAKPGALVCAALQGVAWSRQSATDAPMCALAAPTRFSWHRNARARELVRGGLHLREVPAKIVALGCYADPGWINYEYMAPAPSRECLSWLPTLNLF